MDKIVDVLRELPRSMLLVFRNINLVRSVNKDLGVPVNRVSLMARCAIKGLPGDNATSLVARLRTFIGLVVFDFHLWRAGVEQLFARVLLKLLQLVGRAPADLGMLEEALRAS
eukprot:Colp12_sorted_trinity150504_noHs@13673